jgi:hypothetical protein
MLVDGPIGIQGNGNQDTQSWFHSMQINVLVDSELVVGEWRMAIERAQDTRVAGRVGQDVGSMEGPVNAGLVRDT